MHSTLQFPYRHAPCPTLLVLGLFLGMDPSRMLLRSLIRFWMVLVFCGIAFRMDAQLLSVDAGPELFVCGNQQVVLGGSPTAIGGGGNYTYNWAPAAGLDNALLSNPVCTAVATMVYTVTVSDNLGNSALDSLMVTVQPTPPSAFASAAQDTVCANGSIVLQAAWIPDATAGTGASRSELYRAVLAGFRASNLPLPLPPRVVRVFTTAATLENDSKSRS